MSSPLPNFVTMARKGFRRQRLVLLDCMRGQTAELANFPAHLGHTAEADWKILSLAPGQAGCLLEVTEGDRFRLTAETPRGVRVNGTLLTNTCELEPGTSLIQIGRELIALAVGEEAQEQIEKVQTDDWRLFRIADGAVEAVTRFRELPELARQRGLDPVLYAAAPVGLDSGFHLTQVYEALGVGLPVRADQTETPVLDGSQGEFTCPVCWLKFDAGDAMNIAAHDSLRGDPILGEDARLRFFPTRFNDLGQAIDPLGLPSADLACPHCRRRLPPGFLEVPQFIFSIVGAPSAGKTYYLSILLKVLQQTLFREFGLVLKDGDPTGNMLLNQMKNRLFSASKPEEAILAKTALEGAMYERLPRHGKLVALPRPFAYALGRAEKRAGSAMDDSDHATDCSIIFYDNAGEHFEPGVDVEDSPGALHVASSSAIFFLFDPTSNFAFRKILTGSNDPQLASSARLDQQDSIMSEMEIRVKRLLALESGRKIEVPLVVLVGKCDVWKHLVAWDEFKNPLQDGRIIHAIVDENSARLREFMTKVDPTIVAHAEGLARTVRYFPISAFGHSPSKLEAGASAGLLAPDPKRIEPIFLEIPTLWALSRLLPQVVPAG
jgi:hypothetical protein